MVMDVHGVMLSQVQLPSDSPISSMAWSCEKFKMEESEDGEATSSSNHYCSKRPFLLAVCFKTGGIYLMKSYDDVAPIYIATGMHVSSLFSISLSVYDLFVRLKCAIGVVVIFYFILLSSGTFPTQSVLYPILPFHSCFD